MKKLEDIPKKQVYEAPAGYFDALPGMVQARVAKKESGLAWLPVLKYALPILILALGLTWFLNTGKAESPEQMLGSIEVIDIETYLAEADISTEELLDYIDYDQVQTDSLVFENPTMNFKDEELNELLNDFEAEQ
jgi:hypothetical protein